MTTTSLRLREHRTTELGRDALLTRHAETLWRRHRNAIQIEPPSFQNGDHWRLTPGGVVGQLVVNGELRVWIEPKTPVLNLFQMLCYAYRIAFLAEGDLASVGSLEELCSRLAEVLASRVLDRSRKGFHRDYVGRQSRLPYLRGRPVIENVGGAWADTLLRCGYQEHTADIEDNHILGWTLLALSRSGLGTAPTQKLTRRAYLATRSSSPPRPVRGSDCVGRTYTRLNDDYRSLHAICRFFLEGFGPSHQFADKSTPPFLVNMPKLFEQFVAEWLRVHLPPELDLETQKNVRLGQAGVVTFEIDLVIRNRQTGQPLAVLDTKYKKATAPGSGDVQQVIAYAKTLGCSRAALIYPTSLATSFSETIGGDLKVAAMKFDLDDKIDSSGAAFLQSLMSLLNW